MAKIGFNLAAIGQTVISSAGAESIAGGSNGLTNYYYFLDNAGNISQYVSNGMLSAGVCGVGFTASMKTMLVGSGASTSYVNGTFNTTAAQTMPAATVSELGGGGLNYTTIGGTQYGVNSFPYNILNYPWVNSNDNGLIMYNGFRNYGPTDL